MKIKDQAIRGLKKIYMLAAGTGLTPLFSMIQASSLANDKVKIEIIISNRTKNDIFLKPELDNFVLLNKCLKVHHTLTRHDEQRHGKRIGLFGRIDKDMLVKVGWQLKPSPDIAVFICGTTHFEMDLMHLYESHGFVKNQNIFKF